MEGITNAAVEAFSSRAKQKAGRREFLRGLGVGAVGAAAFGASVASTPAKADATLDAEILTFALNLEYLEAEFYHLAVLGTKLFPSEIGPNPGPTTGGSMVNFQIPQVAALALEIQREEQKHVLFLQSALQAATGSYISKPALNFQTSFQTLAQAAGLGSNFNAFASDTNFLLGAYVFEDVGVTAYHGAAPLISNPAYLDKAAGILAAEAYHAGAIRTFLFQMGMTNQTNLISNLRATLDGTAGTSNLDDYGVGNTTNPRFALLSNNFNGTGIATNNAIAYDRTTRQVLNIVYGGVNATSGLFFPNGLNGAIK